MKNETFGDIADDLLNQLGIYENRSVIHGALVTRMQDAAQLKVQDLKNAFTLVLITLTGIPPERCEEVAQATVDTGMRCG